MLSKNLMHSSNIIFADVLGEYLAGSPGQRSAVIPFSLQYSKSVPPGAEAISIITHSGFKRLITSFVIT